MFDTKNVTVNPHKARIYGFIITEEYIVNKSYDINNCKVFFKE